ncbi:MAG: YhcH/YjgK/YiaL family protein [Acholeplasmataceae bacterium]|nr:YhcH/YjgK/YiaL family protein [Acholeplasmataceae bacterium]
MIVDHLDNLDQCTFLNPNISMVVAYIKHTDLLNLPQGKTVILDDEIFVLRETYQPRELSECFFEGHLKYLDIQIVLKGSEYIGYSNKQNKGITITEVYNLDKDIEKYQVTDFTRVHLYEGIFALLTPDDLHMPKLKKENNEIIEKIVFKIKHVEIKE